MKGSAIVQGLKSWASALHPQLPLSRRESQRLLNALTSSFRRQLEDEHPPHENSDARPQLDKTPDAGVRTDRSQGLHSSSAAFADRHLQSVLTNPLLAHGKVAKKPDAATVTAELQKNPKKDPIELLEEYQQRGHATVPIAVACLDSFAKTLESLPEDERKGAIAETGAGKRTLLWIWKNKVYNREDFNANPRLADRMVYFIVQEGQDKYLWNWLNMDIAVGSKSSLPRDTPASKAKRFPYRWKGRIVSAVVRAKLHDAESCDEAISTLLKANKLEPSWYIPLTATIMFINRVLKDSPKHRLATSPELYDRYIDFMSGDRFDEDMEAMPEFRYRVCWLHLNHPRQPTPLPALALFKQIFQAGKMSDESQILHAHLINRKQPLDTRNVYWLLAATAARLEDMGREADAQWLKTVAKDGFAVIAHKIEGIEQQVQRERELYSKEDREYRTPSVTGQAAAAAAEEEKPDGMPMPSFAI